MSDRCGSDIEKLDYLFDLEVLRIISEPTRLAIIRFLALHGENNINIIAENFKQDRSVISKHLKIMKEAQILIMRKEGRRVYYQLDGIEFLYKLEEFTEVVRGYLQWNCDIVYDEIIKEGINYRTYLERQNDKEPR